MQALSHESIKATLFGRTETQKRQYPKQFLYAPFSRKLFRRVNCYTHARYDLWALIESDLSVKTYNEMPGTITVASDEGITNIKPAFSVEKDTGEIQVHFIDRNDQDLEAILDITKISSLKNALDQWSETYNFDLVCWTLPKLRENLILLSNLHQLLRFVCIPHFHVQTRLIQNIDSVVRSTRFCTVEHVLLRIPNHDQDVILTAIAKMILDQQFYSDIHKYQFHFSTQLSVHHAFE